MISRYSKVSNWVIIKPNVSKNGLLVMRANDVSVRLTHKKAIIAGINSQYFNLRRFQFARPK